MEEKIKDIVQRYAGAATCYEILFRPKRFCRPEDIKFVYDSWVKNYALSLRPDIDLLELWAYDYDFFGEEEYLATFECSYDFKEIFGDANAEVLVIWLSKLSYEILTHPDIKPVRDFRLECIGKYHDYYVVSRVREKAQPRHDDWDDEEEYFDQEEDYDALTNYHVEQFKVRSGAKADLDKLYASESILVSADDLGLRYELEGADAWWDEETPLEHFGREDADVLLIVLA